jgi:predicted nuclease of predicted toxin-antitoxin system
MVAPATRVLFDACVPRRLDRELAGFSVEHITELGLADLDDGPLLDAIASRCDAFVTLDKGIPHQQRISHRPFAVVVLRAQSNRLTDLIPLVPKLRAQLKRSTPGSIVEISG